jgi:hypothetical protein
METPASYLVYPTLIEVAGTTGSGFHVYDDDSVYLVSARHVLFKDSISLFESPITFTSLDRHTLVKPVQKRLDSRILFADDNLIGHPNPGIDIAVCRIGKARRVKEPGGAGFRVKASNGVETITKGKELLQTGFNVKAFALSANIEPGEMIFSIGYPTSLARTDSALDRAYPLLRSGIVAGKPPSGKLLIDCPTYPGNSGGVVIRSKSRNPIGVAVKNVGFTEKLFSSVDQSEVSQRRHNSGYTVVEPMDRVIEAIAELNRLASRAQGEKAKGVPT